jgi:hypothetical protein
MQNKLIRNIIFSVLGLLILGGAYYYVEKMPTKNEKKSEDTTKTENIEVVNFKTEDIKEVNIKNETSLYTVYKKDKENYGIKEYSNIEFSNSRLSLVFSDFASILAQSEIKDAAIGFVEKATAKITLNDGNFYTLILGDKVIGSEGYFLKYNDKIFVIDSYKSDSFLKEVNSFRETTLATIDNKSISKFSLSGSKGKILDIKLGEQKEMESFGTMAQYAMTYPKYKSVDSEKFGKILEPITQISVKSFVEDNPRDISKYGIGKLSLTIADKEKTINIRYGNKDEKGDVYAMLEGKNFVFTQESAMFDSLSKIEPLGLIETFAHIVNIDRVNNVLFNGNGKSYNLVIKGEGETKTYFINDKEIKEDVFKKAYQAVLGLFTNGFLEKPVSGAPDYTVVFYYKDGTKDTIDYISYNDRNYAVAKNGISDYIILKKNLSAQMAEIEKLIQ